MSNNNLRVITININSWCPITRSYSYAERIKHIKNILSSYNPHVIAIQELYSGKINLLEKAFSGEYYIFYPMGFDLDAPHSLITATLLSKSFFSATTLIAPPSSCSLPNRFTIVHATPEDRRLNPVTIMNIYIVTLSGRSNDHFPRKKIHENLWNTTYSVLDREKEANHPTILIGDLQESSSGPNCQILRTKYNMFEPIHNLPTTTNPHFGSNNSIDHIWFSPLARESYGPSTFTISNELSYLTDHAVLIANA